MKRLLMLLAITFLLVSPAAAQSFDYPIPTYITEVTSTTITVFAWPGGFQTFDCPSTGILGKFCATVTTSDTAGFEGELPSDLQVAEISQGYAFPSPAWEITSGTIDDISTDGNYIIFDVDDGSSNVDVYCDVTKGFLGTFCYELEIDDTTYFQGQFFAGDHDIPYERELVVIRAED